MPWKYAGDFMNNWIGLLVFFAVVIANVVTEQKKLQKRREQNSGKNAAPPSLPSPESGSGERRERSGGLREFLDEILQQRLEMERTPEIKESPPAKPRPPVEPLPEAKPAPAQPLLRKVTRLKAASWRKRGLKCSKRELRRAVVMKEVLGRPLGL